MECLSQRQKELKELQKTKKLWWQKYKAAAMYRFFAPCYMEQFQDIKFQWNTLLWREEYMKKKIVMFW